MSQAVFKIKADRKNEHKEGIFLILLLRYTFVFIIAFILGLVVYYLVNSPKSQMLDGYIVSFFSLVFDPGKDIFDNAALVVFASSFELKTLVYIFVAGFTMFSSVAIYWILCTQACSLGFSSIYLVNSMSSGSLSLVGFHDLILFLLTGAAISSVMLVFSAKTRVFNDVFRNLGNRKKLIIRSKPLYIQIFTLISLCGAVILIYIFRFIFNSV